MNRRRGYTLLEMLCYIAILIIAMNLLANTVLRFKESHDRVDAALRDLEAADRFLADVKADLRGCRAVGVEEATLVLEDRDGLRVTYEFSKEDSTVHRFGKGVRHSYGQAFDEVRFTEEEDRIVAVDVLLRKHDPASPLRPRLGAAVYCRNAEE